MVRYIIALALLMHGIGHVLFIANAWGYWKAEAGRAWVFDDILNASQAVEGVIGLVWLIPLVGFGAVAAGYFADLDWWRNLALLVAVLSSIMLVVWWGSLSTSAAFFALLFNIVVVAALLWQEYGSTAEA